MPRHAPRHAPVSTTTAPRAHWRSWVPHAAGVAWIVVAAGAVLAPALAHGASLGPFDRLASQGLSMHAGVRAHYSGPPDQIEQMIPWTTLAWTQVHHGHLPLWNPYSGLGMPLAFNWQSGVFSLPALVGYLFPVRLAYTAAMFATLVIAGTGMYVFGRIVGLGWLGCVTAASAYELSGPLMGWLGWPNAGVMAWAGWLFAAGLLIVRGHHRVGAVALFAIVAAFAVYAGMPEGVVILGAGVALFAAIMIVGARRRDPTSPIIRPVTDLALATVAGAALSAPLALPGTQVVSASVARAAVSYGALRPHDLLHILFQGFDGLPVAGSQWFGHSLYPESAAYVGVVALVLAFTAVALRRGQLEVVAVAVVAIVAGLVAYVGPLTTLFIDVTGVRSVAWHRAVIEMAFGIAALAGVGADVVVRQWREHSLRIWLGGGFAALAVILALVWLFGRGGLSPAEATLRSRSFLWPVAETALGLAVAGALVMWARNRRTNQNSTRGRRGDPGIWAAAVLLAGETAFLVAAGAPLVSSSPTFLAPTAAETTLQRAVGASIVAFGAQECHGSPTLGILQDVNAAYGVHELAVYDPMIPRAVFRSWQSLTGRPATTAGAPLLFCPAVTTAALARQYGASFVLVPRGAPSPRGAAFVQHVGDEDLYRVPGAAEAVETPLGRGDTPAASTTSGAPLSVSHPGPASWRLFTAGQREGLVRFHLTATPGWHATIDGRPLALRSDDAMLEARVPAGRHIVALDYRPTAFTAGVVLAGVSAAALVAAAVLPTAYRRRRRPPPRV